MRILKRMPTTKYYKDLMSTGIIFRIAIMDSSIKVRKVWDKERVQNHTILIANRKRIIWVLHRNRLKRRILCVGLMDQVLKRLQCTVLCNTITLKINFLLVRTVTSKGAYFLLIKVWIQILWMVKTWQSYHLQESVETNILDSFSRILLKSWCSHTTLKDQWGNLQRD